jgi:hypothetical protein
MLRYTLLHDVALSDFAVEAVVVGEGFFEAVEDVRARETTSVLAVRSMIGIGGEGS